MITIIEDTLEGISRGTEDLLIEKKRIADKLALKEKQDARKAVTIKRGSSDE